MDVPFVESGESTTTMGVINFYSGEIADLESKGPFTYYGTPTVSSTSTTIGLQFIYGATSIDSILGKGEYEGYTFSLANIVDTEIEGKSLNPNGTPLIDPISKRPVTFKETDAGVGIGVFSRGADLGWLSGKTDTQIRGFYYKSPWWPIKTEKE